MTVSISKGDSNKNQKIDIAFAMDCTGSMGAYIKSVRNNVSAIASKLAHGEKCDVRFAMVAYRDHPPQEKSFISKTFDFTHSASVMENYLSQVSAAGGGDGPEAVDAALQGCLELPWRKDAAKICVLIADAPPHGLGEAPLYEPHKRKKKPNNKKKFNNNKKRFNSKYKGKAHFKRKPKSDN